MACRGVHFAVNSDDADRLLRAPDDNETLRIVQDEIEERWEQDWLLQTDKAWDAIHRCLSDGTLVLDRGEYPKNLAILGGRQLYHGENYIMSLVTPDQAKALALALGELDEAWLRGRYSSIDQDDYQHPKSDEDFAYTWDNFKDLAPFFKRAAEADRHVLFTVDQ